MGGLRFLRKMRGGIKASDGILRQQETQWQDVQPIHVVARKAGIIYLVGKHPFEGLVFGWRKNENRNDQGSAKNMPPYRDIVQHSLYTAAEYIECSNQDHDHHEPEKLLQDIIAP